MELFRIMPLERFLQLIYTKQNVLVRPSEWSDPYDCPIEKSAMILEPNKIEQFDFTRWYGQCWSSNPNSDALWHIYTKGKIARAVKIKTTANALMKDLHKDTLHLYFLERMKYTEQSKEEIDVIKNLSQTYQFEWEWGDMGYLEEFTDDPQIKAIPMLLTKRAPFKYEEEVRLLCFCTEKQPEEDKLHRYSIHDLSSFIQDVQLDPWTPEGIDDIIKDIIQKFIPNNNISVTISTLYKKIDKGFLYDPYHYYNNK